MSSSKQILTVRHLLCYIFIFAAFFNGFSSGFQWIRTPEAKTCSQIGKPVTIRWHYDLAQDESHYQSDIKFKREAIATRHKKDEFDKRRNITKFSVNGTNDIFFTLFDAQATFDGTFCLEVAYNINSKPSGVNPSSCTEHVTFAYPFVDVYPKRMVVNVTDRVLLYCNATGKPAPDITWRKADDVSTVLASSSWYNLSVTGPSVQGVYMCMANHSCGTDNKTFFVEVQYKPFIHTISKSQIKPEGSSVSLYCNASGHPNPTVSWVKKDMGNVVISGQGNVTLQIANVSRTDAGDYYCTATNILGNSTNGTSITVYSYPLVKFSPKKVIANVTDRLPLYCNATGWPVPHITWRKADDLSTILASSSWFNLSVTGPSVQGVYMCMANNSFGTDNETFFVEVQYKPFIHTISESQIKPEGSFVSLYCNASGHPNPTVSWAKKDMGNVLISDQGNVTLQISNVSRADAGDYYCTATNILGNSTNGTTITVYYRPVGTNLTAEPGNEVIADKTLVLTCTSSALPAVTYFEFYCNGSLVGNKTDGVLKIENITSSEIGEYKCIPSNMLGPGVSASAIIDVLVPPSFEEYINGSVTKNESDTLELKCKAEGNPPPVITWTKDSKFLYQDNIFRKENINRHDAGVYRCTANNSVLNPVQSEATVIVYYAPEITHVTRGKTVNESDLVALKCNASGLPFPRVQWFKGNVSLGNDTIGYASETLTSVTWKDTGKYTCKAVNLLGAKDNTTELTVQFKPINTKLTTDTGKHEVVVNKTLILRCSTQGFPPADWFTFSTKNGTLQSSRNSTYVIKKQTWSPTEEYTCLPENVMGNGTSTSINITFLEPPSFKPLDRTQEVNETNTIRLECLAKGRPKPAINWTKDGSSDVIGTDEVFIKNNTIRSDAGTYRCTASNGVGKSIEALFTVVVNYKPVNTRLTSSTGREIVAINESLTLNCTAQAVPSPHTFRFKVNRTTLNYTSSNGIFVVYKERSFYDENYTCVAINMLGEGKESNTLTITMFEPAMIYKTTGNVTVDENKTITLECRAQGKPKPSVTWTKGDSKKVIGRGEIYIKDRAEKCDAGIYTCTADNGVRQPVYAQATVAVKSYPGIPKILHIAISIPRIEVHWEQPASNCSLPITGYLAQVRKKESQGGWTECDAKREKTYWTCSFGELESSTTYTLQIFARNRFGNGMPAEQDFETKDEGSLSGSTDASKGGLAKKSYIIIGACIGGLFLLIIIVVVVKKFRAKHGESTLQLPLELREPEDGRQNSALQTELQNGHDGPMTASQETLDVKETQDVVEVEAKDSVEDNKL